MSTNIIDDISEREAKHLLNDISMLLAIPGNMRYPETILEIIRFNMKVRDQPRKKKGK